jgi:pimeloyl-ACP methyl ester carboxylesterase
MNSGLLDRFCTPPKPPLTDFDAKVTAQAVKIEVPFEGTTLSAFCWGKGKPVLLVHGWGSRASHLALIGRALAKEGFAVTAPDMPAHSSTGISTLEKSNMFQYGRALSAVAKSVGPVHAVVGHSFGAMCGAFVLAGLGAFADHRVDVPRLVLMSTPPTIASVLESFCRHDEVGASGFPELKEVLEKGFDFRVDDYTIARALPGIKAKTLLIHDEADEEFPVREILSIHEGVPEIEIFVTQGSGHQRILGNRAVITRVKEFLL